MFKGLNSVKLSSTEYRILHYFIDHEGQVISRDKFLDEVWGYDSYPTTRTVDNYILSLRKKIEDDPANPKHLLTVHKVGYKFQK
jgi:DNA-binding response OmpR family regulator